MRKMLSTWVLVLGLLGASNAFASASFANRNLGLGVSAMKLLGDSIGINWAVPISLEGGLYIGEGFEIFLRPQFYLVDSVIGANTPSGQGVILGGGGHAGARYLFLEESIRPYVGLQISVIALARQPQVDVYAGGGVQAGIDFFVADSISLGFRGYFDIYIVLNKAPSFDLGGGLYATTYF